MTCTNVSANVLADAVNDAHLAFAHRLHSLLHVGNDQVINGSALGKRVPELNQRRKESRKRRRL